VLELQNANYLLKCNSNSFNFYEYCLFTDHTSLNQSQNVNNLVLLSVKHTDGFTSNRNNCFDREAVPFHSKGEYESNWLNCLQRSLLGS